MSEATDQALPPVVVERVFALRGVTECAAKADEAVNSDALQAHREYADLIAQLQEGNPNFAIAAQACGFGTRALAWHRPEVFAAVAPALATLLTEAPLEGAFRRHCLRAYRRRAV